MYNEIREWTTPTERMDIAREHKVKTRAQISNILNGHNKNIPLLEALIAKAEANKRAAEELQQRAKALGSR